MALSKEQKRFWTIIKHGYDPAEVLKTNTDLIRAIKISKRLDKVIKPLARYIFEEAKAYSNHHNYHGYTFKDDMASHATLLSMNSILKFDANKSNNPRAYLHICFRSAFMNYIHKEKKQWTIKDDLKERIENGQLD